MNKRICVVGGGRWGENHIRTLHELGHLAAIVEPDQKRLTELQERYPVKGYLKLEEASRNGYDGFILSAPAETHYPLGKKLLEEGQNVLIEKPLALDSGHSEELVKTAENSGARLMVGHLLLFHPAIRKIKELIETGKIGRLYYIYSNRLNLGKVRTKENVFWSFAPHDISVIDYLVGEKPLAIEAKGAKFLQDEIYDVTMTQFTYPDNVHAHIYVSWLHPFKEQRLVVVGSKGMLSFDDSSEEKNINYYNKCIDWVDCQPVKVEQPDEIVFYERKPPLTEELQYFLKNLEGEIEIACGKTGHEVVKVLEKVQDLITGPEQGV